MNTGHIVGFERCFLSQTLSEMARRSHTTSMIRAGETRTKTWGCRGERVSEQSSGAAQAPSEPGRALEGAQ